MQCISVRKFAILSWSDYFFITHRRTIFVTDIFLKLGYFSIAPELACMMVNDLLNASATGPGGVLVV